MLPAAIIITIPYAAILLYLALSLKRTKQFTNKGDSKTFVSVIVACRNEEKNLPALLEALASQDHQFFEVIVVDDSSADGTAGVAMAYETKLPVKVVKNSGSGKKEAIRTGIIASSSELILVTDADCIPPGRWISCVASFFDRQSPDLIICPVILGEKEGFFGRFQELEFLSLQGITAATALSGNPVICNGANLAFTKKAYHDNAGSLRFDIATGDDVFLLHSMKAGGYKISWLESLEALVQTKPSPDLKSFFTQRRRWASKAPAYKDTFSILLGIVTFVTILLQALLTIAAFTGGEFLLAFIAVFIMKSVPDFIILRSTTLRYRRTGLLWWFIPSQVVYPFYVIGVVGMAKTPAIKSGAGSGVNKCPNILNF
jgi:cellulose synthase/poly-beta-1,6-N-acetylglucosamine synthase-like glycosyltransferase